MSSFGSAFWERLWRASGVNFVAFYILGYFVYGHQGIAADRTRILVASFILGMSVLNLMWFAAAVSAVLRDAGQAGWATAETAASATVGGVSFVLIAIGAAMTSMTGPANSASLSALNNLAWAVIVMSSFPRAMMIMAPTFGLWRAGRISNSAFAAGVAAVVLGVLGGTTWASDGIWAPTGAYSRFVWPAIGIVWIMAISWLLLVPARSTARADAGLVPQPQW